MASHHFAGTSTSTSISTIASRLSLVSSGILSQFVRKIDRCLVGEPLTAMVKRIWCQVCVTLALLLWLGIFHFNFCAITGALLFWPHPLAVAILVIYVSLMFLPIPEDSPHGIAVARFVTKYAPSYFPIKIIYEDEKALDPKRAHVIALEPHSVLPLGCIAFCPNTNLTPFAKVRTLASTTLHWVPLARHILTWLGMAAVSKASFMRLLKEGTSCVVIPGGVQECLYMNNHQEVLFLKKRKGFVKLAIKAGAPLVPVFVFGQRDTYRFWFPRQDWFYRLSRRIGFAPLYFWGMYGSPLPYPRPMTMVVGRPIEVEQRDVPTDEEVTAVQNKFLEAMQRIYDRYKVEAGAKNIELLIM